jgi:hypothetical protein
MGSSNATATFIIFDADVLIKLAQHPANVKAIEAITRAVENGVYNLVVPEPVLAAFNREKERAAEAYWNAHRTTIKNLRYLGQALPNASEVAAFADRLSTELTAHTSDVPDTIKAVEVLLDKGRQISATIQMKSSAADRVAQHKAPAKKATNSSINDCIIWEIAKKHISEGELIFVTDNYTDFSDPTHREKLHPDLLSELEPSQKVCYHSLEGFRKKHINSVEIVAPSADSIMCPICWHPISPSKIPRPSQYGGWSYHLCCGSCGRYIDTGDPYDD